MQKSYRKISHSIIFPSDTDRSLELASKNWEEFISTGEFKPLTPRSVICESWIRSRERGLDPSASRAPTAITVEELEEKLRLSDLGQAAIGAMEKMADSLNGSKHIIALGDSHGRILHTVGHKLIQSHLEEINFRPGGSWDESEVGPNGIGTPITLRRPEVIMGHEHYCKAWQPWVCYGSPIPDANGTGISGVIDITGPVSQIRPESMALAISLSQTIHSGLSILQLNRREILRGVCRDKMMRWPNDGVLVIDENGYLIDYNTRAARLMTLKFPDCIEKPVTQFLPDIWDVTHRSIKENIMEEMKMELRTDTGFNHNVRVRIEPVLYNQENLGALLVVTGRDAQKHKTKDSGQKGHVNGPTKYTFDHIRGSSPELQNVLILSHAAARDPLESNVLLIGDTGTGKELIAHSIHAESLRSEKPFIAINCGALPHELIESELFGYVPGAFTGARKDGMKGKFEHAAGGTLFLDEIDSLDPDLQSKFLRVLDHNEINRIGCIQPINVDVRIIAAGSPDIHRLIETGRFRHDLFHRLSVLEIDIPSLHERGEDVIDLACEFLERECWAAGKQLLYMTDEVKQALLEYTWPGNVRELLNLCRRWILMVPGDCIKLEHLPEKMCIEKMKLIPEIQMHQDLRTVNDDLIRTTLAQTGGNVSKAARILGIDRTTIYRRKKCWETRTSYKN